MKVFGCHHQWGPVSGKESQKLWAWVSLVRSCSGERRAAVLQRMLLISVNTAWWSLVAHREALALGEFMSLLFPKNQGLPKKVLFTFALNVYGWWVLCTKALCLEAANFDAYRNKCGRPMHSFYLLQAYPAAMVCVRVYLRYTLPV